MLEGSVRSIEERLTNGDESGSQETGALRPELLGQQVSGDGRETAEEWRQKDANLSNVNGHVERVENPVDSTRCEHEARVDGAADDTAQRVPGALVEPVEKVVVAILDHVVSGAVVEPGIEFVNDALVANY